MVVAIHSTGKAAFNREILISFPNSLHERTDERVCHFRDHVWEYTRYNSNELLGEGVM